MKRYLLSAVFILSLESSAFAEVVTLTSKDGKSLVVTLVAKQGDKVLVKRASDNKEFALSLDTLNAESRQNVTDKMKSLKDVYPPLELDVVLGKRRTRVNRSYYMKDMEITAKVTVTNKDRRIPCPQCFADIIFIGQNQRDPDLYKVMSTQRREVKPTEKGASFDSTPFVTRYDSYNKGYNNAGGHKYVGYVLVVSDQDGKVLHTKATSGFITKALDSSVTKSSDLMSYAKNTVLDKGMNKL